LVGQYAQVCLQVGQEAGVTTVDLFSTFVDSGDLKSLLLDGLHPSALGSDRIWHTLRPVITTKVVDPPMFFPYFGDITMESLQNWE